MTLSVAEVIKSRVSHFQRGRVFSTSNFANLGSQDAVHQELSRLTQKGEIQRIQNGIYYKPKRSTVLKGRFLPPDTHETVKVISQKNNEKIQLHGGVAANRLGLSTQVPVMEVYYTTGVSREFKIAGTQVRMIHTKNMKIFQKPLSDKVGLAISALITLGRNAVSAKTIKVLKANISSEEFEALSRSELPGWLSQLLKMEVSENHA